jgi:hypothetical protein
MPFSGMWRRVDLVGTDVSEERVASSILRKIHTAPYPRKGRSSIRDLFSTVVFSNVIQIEVEVEVNFRPTVRRPVYLGVGLPSGAHDQIFVFCLTIAGFLMCGTLSDERMGL